MLSSSNSRRNGFSSLSQAAHQRDVADDKIDEIVKELSELKDSGARSFVNLESYLRWYKNVYGQIALELMIEECKEAIKNQKNKELLAIINKLVAMRKDHARYTGEVTDFTAGDNKNVLAPLPGTTVDIEELDQEQIQEIIAEYEQYFEDLDIETVVNTVNAKKLGEEGFVSIDEVVALVKSVQERMAVLVDTGEITQEQADVVIEMVHNMDVERFSEMKPLEQQEMIASLSELDIDAVRDVIIEVNTRERTVTVENEKVLSEAGFVDLGEFADALENTPRFEGMDFGSDFDSGVARTVDYGVDASSIAESHMPAPTNDYSTLDTFSYQQPVSPTVAPVANTTYTTPVQPQPQAYVPPAQMTTWTQQDQVQYVQEQGRYAQAQRNAQAAVAQQQAQAQAQQAQAREIGARIVTSSGASVSTSTSATTTSVSTPAATQAPVAQPVPTQTHTQTLPQNFVPVEIGGTRDAPAVSQATPAAPVQVFTPPAYTKGPANDRAGFVHKAAPTPQQNPPQFETQNQQDQFAQQPTQHQDQNTQQQKNETPAQNRDDQTHAREETSRESIRHEITEKPGETKSLNDLLNESAREANNPLGERISFNKAPCGAEFCNKGCPSCPFGVNQPVSAQRINEHQLALIR